MLLFVHCLSGCDTTNFFFGVGKASFLNYASPTFASKMVFVTEQIKDAEGKLSVDAFREDYDLSKSLVIEMYGKQPGFNSLASVRAYIWYHKQDVRRLPPSDDTFEPCIRRAIFATWIILSSVQARPSIPDPFLHGWKMAEGGVDAVVSCCKEASSLEAYCRCKVEDAGKTMAAQKWMDVAAYAPASKRGGHAGSIILPHLNSRKKKMRNVF